MRVQKPEGGEMGGRERRGWRGMRETRVPWDIVIVVCFHGCKPFVRFNKE